MKIALFGGAFDPPHLGHQLVGREVTQRGIVDEVWYVPVYQHPWAERLNKFSMAPYEDRKKMVELVLSPQTQLKEYLDVSYTYPTLKHFQAEYHEHEFSWIIGSEYLDSFADWKFVDEILAEFTVYVYPREGFPFKNLMDGMMPLEDFPEMAVASTEIRQRLAVGESISELVDPVIERYIQQQELYR